MTKRTLIVQADDLGMCPAVTDGILLAHTAGVVTQASVMMPAPDSPRALWLARRYGLPLGVHLVLVCEWDGLRYYPLTPGPSLRAHDGAFLNGIDELQQTADPGEALVELRAQLRAAHDAGVHPTHIESHVGVFDPGVLAQLSREWSLPCRDPLPPPSRPLAVDTIWHLSLRPPAAKQADLRQHLAELPPGVHMVVAHPAMDRPELKTLCHPSSGRWKWARDVRVSDLETLLDPAFRATCAEHDITLSSLSRAATPKSPAK